MSPEETRMMEAIDRSREKLHKIARRIWEFKEVGWEEFNSSLLLMNELEREGFEVERGLTGRHPKFDQEIDMPTAFKAVFHGKEDGPVVGVLLEYDALSNGHACGHNLISSAGFAAALELKEAFQEKGTVIVYGTPAEELEGSKHYILEGGCMDEVDLMLASHYGSDWGSEVTGKAIVWPTHDNWVTFKGLPCLLLAGKGQKRPGRSDFNHHGTGIFKRAHAGNQPDSLHYFKGRHSGQLGSRPGYPECGAAHQRFGRAEFPYEAGGQCDKGHGADDRHDACVPLGRSLVLRDAGSHPVPQSGPVCRGSGNRSLLRPDGRSGSGRASRRPGCRPAFKRGS